MSHFLNPATKRRQNVNAVLTAAAVLPCPMVTLFVGAMDAISAQAFLSSYIEMMPLDLDLDSRHVREKRRCF